MTHEPKQFQLEGLKITITDPSTFLENPEYIVQLSIALSLKRIADALTKKEGDGK